MQPIFLSNTLTKKKEEFVPLVPGKAGIYTCGPTVYDRGHIGNFRSFIFADILRRVLEANDYEVKHVINITDVGHLVGDGDEGEDKMEKGSKKTGKTAWEVAEEYTKLYLADSERLNLLEPTYRPKATDHIAEQIEMIEALEKNGHTYRITDGIYFDTSTLADYGRLSGQKLEDKEGGVRVEIGEKKNSADFALWKFSPEGEKRQMEWPSPWGIGFPGWHIECSAMSEKYLGVPFDLHTGGIDHIAVHHENELAQTEGARGKLEANYWLHNEFLMVDGGKMSKSLGNTYSLDDVAAKGLSPMAFRYFVLGAHYKTLQNFTWDALQASQNALDNLIHTVVELPKPGKIDEASKGKFLSIVNNDLDTPNALAYFFEVLKDETMGPAVKAATLKFFDSVLGLGLGHYIGNPVIVPAEVQALADERVEARKAKNWKESDRLREAIAQLGFVVEDGAGGQKIREER
ncbi:MAG: cysteine--tRNA ligase [Patescibacteria group bacterium]|jgi:cysteinyl-tRNA synthetase